MKGALLMDSTERIMYGFARSLLYSAGSILKQERRHGAFQVREKTSAMDLVTDQDLAVEKYLIESILAKYPGHCIISEESCARVEKDTGRYTWIIDPIDGTVNYYRFGKDYAISLAVYRSGEPVFGLVYDVAAETMFSAGTSEDAAVNGRSWQVRTNGPSSLNKSVVAISNRTMKELAGRGMNIWGVLSGVQAHRYLGCASLELCKVAAGEYDLFISASVYIWDVAAARIFLEQKGGTILCGGGKQEAGNCGRAASFGNLGNPGACGKLLVAAFRSPAVWQEALGYFPQEMKAQFENPDRRDALYPG
jgi:myo-inositol-1(or 4)-monophosphatase